VFCAALFTFFYFISFAESDYQIYVVSNNPEETGDFHSKSVSSIIDKAASETMLDNDIYMMFSDRHDYNDNQQTGREKLLDELESMVNLNVWPLWFKEHADNDFYDFKSKRNNRIDQLNYFIERHSGSKRMPIALYYKALLKEYQPDPVGLRQKEVLEYYNDYPRAEVFPDWVRLYRDYPQSPESLEARWRIATNLCRKGDFQTAKSICRETTAIAQELLDDRRSESSNDSAIFSPPPDTAITSRKLEKIIFRAKYLVEFLENNSVSENRSYKRQLAVYFSLNPYSSDYKEKLETLLERGPEDNPLADNIKLAIIMEQPDPSQRCGMLDAFISEHRSDDGIAQAMYELALCNVQLWRETLEESPQRIEYLIIAREILTTLTEQYPDSVFQIQARQLLNGLPQPDVAGVPAAS
jgi:hypothetical protein